MIATKNVIVRDAADWKVRGRTYSLEVRCGKCGLDHGQHANAFAGQKHALYERDLQKRRGRDRHLAARHELRMPQRQEASATGDTVYTERDEFVRSEDE